jgi:Autotransporter beta-domain
VRSLKNKVALSAGMRRHSLRLALLGGISVLPLAASALLPGHAARAQSVSTSVTGPVDVTAANPDLTVTNTGVISGSATGVLNQTITGAMLSNSGSISGSSIGVDNQTGASFSALNNGGTITGTGNRGYGIANATGAAIGLLSNTGNISGDSSAINNQGSIATLSNTGVIVGTGVEGWGIENASGATIGLLSNSGTILGMGTDGIDNAGGIGTLSNSGTMLGMGRYGIDNSGSIGTLSNTGSISGGEYGIYNEAGATIGSVNNSGVIAAYDTNVENYGSIGTLSNSGTISSTNDDAINNDGTIGTLSNSGVVSSEDTGIYNDEGSIGTLSNSGSISSRWDRGIDNYDSTISMLTNSGSISSDKTGIYNESGGSIGTLSNSGSILVLDAPGIVNENGSTITTLVNAGNISGDNSGIQNNGTIGALSNSGSISGVRDDGIQNGGTIGVLANNNGGVISGYQYGIYNGNGATIGALTNIGKISGGTHGLVNDGTIGALTNNGVISGGTDGVYNQGSIGTLTNSGVISGGKTGVNNGYGSLGALTNSGTISGGNYAIFSYNGDLGTLTNSGVISGNVEIEDQNVTIVGASTGFGTITGGTISVDPTSTITFDGGNELVNASIVSDGNGNGTGTIGVNVGQGMLAYQGTLNGDLSVASGAALMASGTVTGNVAIDGTYEVAVNGSTAGGASTALGANGYYSSLDVGGTIAIGEGATLELVSSDAKRALGLGTDMTYLTADGGITGSFAPQVEASSNLMGVGTQLESIDPPGTLEIVVTPSGAPSPFAAYATTEDARSAANVVDQILARYPTDPATSPLTTLTSAQNTLIDDATSEEVAQVSQFLGGLDGQVQAAMLAVAPQAGEQMAGSIYDRLGEATGDAQPGSQVWSNVSTQAGSRGGDSTANGFTSNVTQIIVGDDLISRGATRLGFGYAYTSSDAQEGSGGGNGKAQENAGFVYGQIPAGAFLIDGMGSYGGSTSNTQQTNPLGGSLLTDNIGGGEALVSLGVSRPYQLRAFTVAPYARVTWQQVTQAGFSEGTSAAALSVGSYAGEGVRGVIGLTGGSAAASPLAARFTYQFNVGVGEDGGNLVNPTLHASLAGIGMTIAAPQESSTFGQASVSGTARLNSTAYVYGSLFGEARGNATVGGVSGGLRFSF